MVENQLIKRGIQDQRVLEAMYNIHRHQFIAQDSWPLAYADHPLSIGEGQTVSQPYIVAWMSELISHLPVGSAILEVGTGCGYQTAILVEMGYEVHTIERISALSRLAKQNLQKLGLMPASLHVGDGKLGHPSTGPYDAIIAAACASKIPRAWKKQLKDGGTIITPLKIGGAQQLIKCTKQGRKFLQERLGLVRFVPLLDGKD